MLLQCCISHLYNIVIYPHFHSVEIHITSCKKEHVDTFVKRMARAEKNVLARLSIEFNESKSNFSTLFTFPRIKRKH